MLRFAVAFVGLCCSTMSTIAGPYPHAVPKLHDGPLIWRIADRLEKSPLDRLLPYIGPQGHEPGGAAAVPEYDETIERSRIANSADRLLKPEDQQLKELENMLETYRQSGERTGAGLFKLVVASRRFDGGHYSNWRQMTVMDYYLTALDQWARVVPGSKFVGPIKAMMLVNKAHVAMSAPYPDDKLKTPPDPMSFLKEAQDVLLADKAGRELNPVWHYMMIKVRAGQGASTNEILLLLDEGSNRFPLVLDIYTGAAEAILASSQTPVRDVAAIAHLAGIRAAS